MTIQHLKFDPSKIIPWSKGTSSEIFIYPSTGDFQTRDFLFRISTATVEAEETIFTNFPNIKRTLMVLKGNLTLDHAGHHSKSMAPFEQDTFMGDWDTKSKGMVTDFNLMCKSGASGILKVVYGSSQSSLNFELNADFELIYLYKGKASYHETIMQPGDCVVIEKGELTHLQMTCEEDCDFVQTSVTLAN